MLLIFHLHTPHQFLNRHESIVVDFFCPFEIENTDCIKEMNMRFVAFYRV